VNTYVAYLRVVMLTTTCVCSSSAEQLHALMAQLMDFHSSIHRQMRNFLQVRMNADTNTILCA
jgi:hypothetical protein